MTTKRSWYYTGKITCRPIFTKEEFEEIYLALKPGKHKSKISSTTFSKIVHYHNMMNEKAIKDEMDYKE